MPLSKARDRDRKRAERAESRLDRQLSPLVRANDVQPKPPVIADKPPGVDYIDADGYPVYND